MTEVAQTGLLASLGLNGKIFIAQLVNFAIIVFVVWRWVYRPLLKVMDSRAQKIAQGLSQSEEAKKALVQAEEQKEKMLHTAEVEAQKTLQQVREDAKQERDRLHKETQAELDRQLSEAKAKLAQEKETMLMEVKKEVGELIVLTTEKVTAGELTVDAQKKLLKYEI